MRPLRAAVRYFSILLLAGIAGCGSSASSVSGELSYAGKPIETGSIRFFPIENTEGTGGVAPISKGHFEIAKKHGLIAGRYMVQITAMQKTGRMIRPREVMPGDDASPQEEEVQIIPAKYNTKSELHTELKPGKNTYDQKLAP